MVRRKSEWKTVFILENFPIRVITCRFQCAELGPEFFSKSFCMVSCFPTFPLKPPELENMGVKMKKNTFP